MNAFNAVVGVIVLVIVFSLLFALPVMWLWDWLMPTIFGLPEITLFQAWGLSALSGLLFKSNTSTSK
jgi:uncharacterized membrane protein